MTGNIRQIMALLLLLVAVLGNGISFCENLFCAGETAESHQNSSLSHMGTSCEQHDDVQPYPPLSSHNPGDHYCLGDCGCPCHAPLTPAGVNIPLSSSGQKISFAEMPHYLPEVYLSLFDPPDIAA